MLASSNPDSQQQSSFVNPDLRRYELDREKYGLRRADLGSGPFSFNSRKGSLAILIDHKEIPILAEDYLDLADNLRLNIQGDYYAVEETNKNPDYIAKLIKELGTIANDLLAYRNKCLQTVEAKQQTIKKPVSSCSATLYPASPTSSSSRQSSGTSSSIESNLTEIETQNTSFSLSQK
jgi:hypothetical protein